MKHRVKIFSDVVRGVVEGNYNEWIEKKGESVEITRTQLSTCCISSYGSVCYTLLVEYTQKD